MTEVVLSIKFSLWHFRPSHHRDAFARDNLPPEDQWPVFEFSLPSLQFSDPFNCGQWLLDEALTEIAPEKPAIFEGDTVWSYAELAAQANRLCHVLTEDLGVVPGNRVLLRGGNSPLMFAAWLAVMKIGAIAVSTMPMLRARELQQIVVKANIALAICADELTGELEQIRQTSPLERIVSYGGTGCELETMMAGKPDQFRAVPTQPGRCLPDRLYLRHHRRAQGDDAFSPRRAGDVRDFRPAYRARR